MATEVALAAEELGKMVSAWSLRRQREAIYQLTAHLTNSRTAFCASLPFPPARGALRQRTTHHLNTLDAKGYMALGESGEFRDFVIYWHQHLIQQNQLNDKVCPLSLGILSTFGNNISTAKKRSDKKLSKQKLIKKPLLQCWTYRNPQYQMF